MKVYNTIQIYDIIIYCGLNQDSTISKCLIPDRCERKKTKKKNHYEFKKKKFYGNTVLWNSL